MQSTVIAISSTVEVVVSRIHSDLFVGPTAVQDFGGFKRNDAWHITTGQAAVRYLALGHAPSVAAHISPESRGAVSFRSEYLLCLVSIPGNVLIAASGSSSENGISAEIGRRSSTRQTETSTEAESQLR